jgi:hypothetical protein
MPQDLGEVINCKNKGEEFSSLRLEKGVWGAVWLKGKIVTFSKQFSYDRLDALVTRISVDPSLPDQPSFYFDTSKPGLIDGRSGKKSKIDSLEWQWGSLMKNAFGIAMPLFGKCTVNRSVAQKALRLLNSQGTSAAQRRTPLDTQSGTVCVGDEAGVSWRKNTTPNGRCLLTESLGAGRVNRKFLELSCPHCPPE